jgi:hypothetical protein
MFPDPVLAVWFPDSAAGVPDGVAAEVCAAVISCTVACVVVTVVVPDCVDESADWVHPAIRMLHTRIAETIASTHVFFFIEPFSKILSDFFLRPSE